MVIGRDVLIFPIVAALVAWGLTKAAMEVLPRFGLVSMPDANHPRPVPVGGGIAVWMTAAAGLIAMAATGHPVRGLGVVFAGATLLFLAGVWDDIRLLDVGSSRVDLQACKLEYSIVSPK